MIEQEENIAYFEKLFAEYLPHFKIRFENGMISHRYWMYFLSGPVEIIDGNAANEFIRVNGERFSIASRNAKKNDDEFLPLLHVFLSNIVRTCPCIEERDEFWLTYAEYKVVPSDITKEEIIEDLAISRLLF